MEICNHFMKSTNSRKLLLVLFLVPTIIGLLLIFLNNTIFASGTVTWDGGGGTNNWSDCVNWTSNTCPGATDDVVFDGTSTKNATIDASFTGTINSFSINSGYTGTITQSRSLTSLTGSTGFAQQAGTYSGGSQTLNIGSFSINGGTFNAPSSLNVGTTNYFSTFGKSGGTFNAGSGTVTFVDGIGTINCSGLTFNSVVFTSTGL